MYFCKTFFRPIILFDAMSKTKGILYAAVSSSTFGLAPSSLSCFSQQDSPHLKY